MAKGLKGQGATQVEAETHRGQRRSLQALFKGSKNMISRGFTASFDDLLVIGICGGDGDVAQHFGGHFNSSTLIDPIA